MNARQIALVCSLLVACSSSEGSHPSTAEPKPRSSEPESPGTTEPPPPTPTEEDQNNPSNPNPPLGVGGGGTGDAIKLASAGDAACTFDVTYTNDPPAPDGSLRYTLSITKRDTREGTCKEMKGTNVLVSSSYEKPVAFIGKNEHERMIVVAYDGRFAADTAIYTRLVQIDWMTGQHLHEGQMAVQGTSPFPIPDALRPTSLTVDARDVVLGVAGQFPGAGAGDQFHAFYTGFLGPDPQMPSSASWAERD
jgi:hypothetical protein